MRLDLASAFALFALTLSAAAQSAPDAKPAPTGFYSMDTRHSLVLFAIRHLGITDYYGRFEKLTGTLNFNSGEPEKSAVNVTIDMNSLNTPNQQLNGELTAPGVFNAAAFPTATFKSTTIARSGPAAGKITGDLTLHGVTKPVTLDVTFGGHVADPFNGGEDIGFHATTVIKRSDFGIKGMAWESVVSDDVKLTIEAMFVHQKEK